MLEVDHQEKALCNLEAAAAVVCMSHIYPCRLQCCGWVELQASMCREEELWFVLREHIGGVHKVEGMVGCLMIHLK